MSSDSSPPRSSSLASKIKAAIDARQENARQEREALEQRRQQAEKARQQLLQDLAEFGRAVGHFEVTHRRDRLTFRFEGRSLCFEPEGDLGEVKITGEDLKGENRLFVQEGLGKWVWSCKPPRGPEQRVMLFDQGLELLISNAMKIKL